jgi:hypothetical protein
MKENKYRFCTDWDQASEAGTPISTRNMVKVHVREFIEYMSCKTKFHNCAKPLKNTSGTPSDRTSRPPPSHIGSFI